MKLILRILLNPVTQLNLLVCGSLFVIQALHTHAHYTMEKDADSYVFNFCKKNVEKCQQFIDSD